MRRNNKQVTTHFILLGLLLIGVVYAILQANLQINGTAKIQANTWDIHFDNIQVNENSVSIGTGDSQATIDSENNCKVDFEVTLSIPGDFYEFTIDVVNAGTIDGMIGELNKTLKVNNEVVSEVPDYLNYSVTYSDGVEIEDNHKIEAGTTETYLVRLEFKTDIEELPQATTITTSLEPQYIQADSSAIDVFHPYVLYNVLKKEVIDNSGLVHEYTGEHKDSFTETGTEKIYYWYASNNDNANIILDKWNVIFAGFCWQMWRTTDTGGVKIIYSGVPSNGKCDTSNNYKTITNSKFNNNRNSIAYFGYKYNSNTLVTSYKSDANEGSLFGNEVSYDSVNGLYTLTDTSLTYDNTHHYTCNNSTGVCSSVRYYYYYNYYVLISDGRNITEAFEDMLHSDNVNQTNSKLKETIDSWYLNNISSYYSQLEDIIFCNDRTVTDKGGWNPNGDLTKSLEFKSNNVSIDLSCINETDQFCLSNIKAQLEYPVGAMTLNEAWMLNNNNLRNGKNYYWLISAEYYNGISPSVRIVDYNGPIGREYVNTSVGVRPVVSLKQGTLYVSGNGSKDNPYIVE